MAKYSADGMSFVAKDATGKEYEIRGTALTNPVRVRGGVVPTEPVWKLVTSEGLEVEHLAKGRYRLIVSRVELVATKYHPHRRCHRRR